MNDRLGSGDDVQRLRHPTRAGFAALRHFAAGGTDHANAVGCELREVALRCLGGPHFGIHRWRNEDRSVGGQQNGGGEIVRVSSRHLGDEISRCGGDDDEIGVACQPYMADVELALRIEQIGVGALAAKCAGGERRDEALRRSRENAAHLRAAILQAPDQIERFVGCDAAADDEEDAQAAGLRSARWLCRGVRWRRELIEDVTAGLLCGLAQDHTDLVFHGSAMPRRAQAQQLLELVIQLSDGEARHRVISLAAGRLKPELIALQSVQSTP